MGRFWRVLKAAVSGFLANDALSRGAAIAFYAATSLAPVLLIVVAIAGLTFGQDAARAAISEELGQLLGPGGGDFIKSMLERSSNPGSGTVAAIFGVLTVLLAASGVFGEMHTALNATFKAKPSDEPISSLIRTRAASLGLVAALGFMLVISLAASAGLSALGHVFQGLFAGKILLAALNTVVSLAIFTLLFTAIYKVLPRRSDTLARPCTGRICHSRALHHRKGAYRNVSRSRGAQFALWRGRRADRPYVLDVLFRANLSLRRRAYKGHR